VRSSRRRRMRLISTCLRGELVGVVDGTRVRKEENGYPQSPFKRKAGRCRSDAMRNIGIHGVDLGHEMLHNERSAENVFPSADSGIRLKRQTSPTLLPNLCEGHSNVHRRRFLVWDRPCWHLKGTIVLVNYGTGAGHHRDVSNTCFHSNRTSRRISQLSLGRSDNNLRGKSHYSVLGVRDPT
jgi:hypothetical protein